MSDKTTTLTGSVPQVRSQVVDELAAVFPEINGGGDTGLVPPPTDVPPPPPNLGPPPPTDVPPPPPNLGPPPPTDVPPPPPNLGPPPPTDVPPPPPNLGPPPPTDVPPPPPNLGPPPPPTVVVPPPPVEPAGKAEYLAARGKLARKETAVAKITDQKGKKKTLKDSYVAEVGKVKAEVDKGDYEEALKLLPELEKALNAAFAARQADIEKETKKKIDAGVKSQTSGIFSKTKVYEKPGSKDWVKMVDKIVAVQLDTDFQEDYDAICEQVSDDIANDPIVKNAYQKWDTWMADPVANKAEVEKFMNQVVKLQCARLGMDPPTPVESKPNPTRPTNVGSFSTSTGKITLNTNNAGNQDFRELLDTLTHENTHAYQTKLIKMLDPPPSLKPGDPDYNAAMVLKFNDFPAGYITSSDAEEYPGYSSTNDPYEKQSCEVHVYRAGARTGKRAHDKLQAG